ncbi:hypothetical protein Tco_0742647 [Tanacetum coccineum]
MEVEPLHKPQLEDLGLNTCNHDISLSSREVPSFDEPKPQPRPLPNCPPLGVNIGDKRGTDPPIKLHSPDSFRVKVVDKSTINTPPSPHVVSFHSKDIYCYYHPYVDDRKKHYGFKPGLLGQGGSLGVDLSNWEVLLFYRSLEFIRYAVLVEVDMAYWEFLGAQIRRIFLDGYGV